MSEILIINAINPLIEQIDYRSSLRDIFFETSTKKIFDNQKKFSDEKLKIKQATAFYEKYGKALTRSMNLMNSGKIDELSSFEKVVFYKKDENQVYKKYYDKFADNV